ncbi:MAG: DUF86 domain-containing protein [bacterium]|nr:DUF86 domain-containing protein [bacterium]
MKNDHVYLAQILDGIEKIEQFASDTSYEVFCTDRKTQSAIILQLMIIGEISKKLSTSFKQTIDLPWKDIAGFRDMAIHDYFNIDIDIVWNTVKDDVPLLKEKITKVL